MTPRSNLPVVMQEQLLLLTDRLQAKRLQQHPDASRFQNALQEQLTMMAKPAWSWQINGIKELEQGNEIQRLNDHWENLLEDYDDQNKDLTPVAQDLSAVHTLLLKNMFDREHLTRLWSPTPEAKAGESSVALPTVFSFLKNMTLAKNEEEIKSDNAVAVTAPGR